MNERTEIIIGKEALNQLSKSKVIVFGVGGVGGYVCEMLARSNVGHLTLVDFDKVSVSNLNRQIVALNSTIGMNKIEVMEQRINDINPACKVEVVLEKLLPENIESFKLYEYDYVIDCIDMVTSKLALIKYCNEKGIKLVSALGAGNKNGIPSFKICDIFETQNDGLAKVLRRELKKLGIDKATVCFTDQKPIVSKVVGSIAYYPAVCGCVIASFVINQLIKNNC